MMQKKKKKKKPTLALKQMAIFTNSDEDNKQNSVKYLRWNFLLK